MLEPSDTDRLWRRDGALEAQRTLGRLRLGWFLAATVLHCQLNIFIKPLSAWDVSG